MPQKQPPAKGRAITGAIFKCLTWKAVMLPTVSPRLKLLTFNVIEALRGSDLSNDLLSDSGAVLHV